MSEDIGTLYTYLIDVRNVQGNVIDLLNEVEAQYEEDIHKEASFICGYDDTNVNHAFMTFHFFDEEGKEDPIKLVARIFNIEPKDFQVRIIKRG